MTPTRQSSLGSMADCDAIRNMGCLSVLASVPSIGEASSYIVQKTSYLSRRISSVIDVQRFGGESALELVSLAPAEHIRNFSSSSQYSSNACSTSEPSAANSSLSNELATTENNPRVGNGSSMFQGIISRVQKTLKGSSNDIGWLQSTPGMPPVEDGTERFLELLDSVRKGQHKLPNKMVYLLIPGLFSNHGPLYFVDTKMYFSKLGLTCHIAKIHSEACVEKNAQEIKDCIEEIYWGSGKQLLLLGHSKGGIDAAAAVSLYWSDLKDKVAGLVLVQSPYGGSPIASDILRQGQLADVETRKVMELLICKVIKGDLQALEDLTYERRREFLMKHKFPEELPVVSFHTEASVAPSVIATLSHIAHAELPRLSLPVFNREEASSSPRQATKVPVVVPLGAAMAACALQLQLRYGEKSDGLVTRKDAEVPGSVVVRPEKKMDHGWMVYSSLNDASSEANSAEVCEALLLLLVEISLKRRHESAEKND